MRIVYPYNEILPTKKAHDVYIFNECTALASLKWDVHLLSGKQSAPDSCLREHYEPPFDASISIHRLPLIRKNNILRLSWNAPFFFYCQKKIKELSPDWVFLSVLKQAAFHLSRKLKNVRYLYEVHELSYYPNQKVVDEKKVESEKIVLEKASLITVTTHALKEILTAPPYDLKTPIEIVPLAAKSLLPEALPFSLPLIITYVGQLYAGQGIELLLMAIQNTQDILLKIVGGKTHEIERLQILAKKLGVEKKVCFLGFKAPSALKEIATHGFVAPFENKGRMACVAHTKLLEYAHSLCPFIAPKLSLVQEHFKEGGGVLLFEPDSALSLRETLNQLKNERVFSTLQEAAHEHKERFSWQKRVEKIRDILKPL